ncbi:MAG: hypothetical protein IT445_15315 [Phycisphaeraceae bacterium]|nr:hypothetical protein [Phycisphaeraceae bacterium]
MLTQTASLIRWSFLCIVAGLLVVSLSPTAQGQISLWDFESLSGGTTLPDQIGSVDGTVNGAVSLVPSGAGVSGLGFGNAGALGSTSGDLIDLGDVASFDFGTSAFSVAGWVRPNSGSSNNLYRFVLENGVHNQGGFNVVLGRSGASFRGKLILDVKGPTNISVFSDTRIDDDNWHWFAVVSDGATATMYVDGVLQLDSKSVAGTTATAPSGSNANIGHQLDGDVDQLAVYNSALTGTLDGGASGTLISGPLYDLWQQSFLQPGDANGDGMVNLSDLQILGDNWQSTTATWAEADFTGDSTVNLADLQILGDNWGFGTGPDVSFGEALAGASIPEPASLLLLGSALPLILRRRALR